MNNTEDIMFFKEKAQKYLDYAENLLYDADICELIENIKQYENKLYCKKSDLYLGYFNPCPVADLIVGKCDRGNIYKKKPLGKNIITYYFDDNKLRMAEDEALYYVWFYADTENVCILGFKKNNSKALSYITLCKYRDSEIVSITDLNCTENVKSFPFSFFGAEMLCIKGKEKEYMFELTEKEYIYKENHIEVLKIAKIDSFSKKCRVKEYIFEYADDNYASYRFSDTQYKIANKRKFNELNKIPDFSDIF